MGPPGPADGGVRGGGVKPEEAVPNSSKRL